MIRRLLDRLRFLLERWIQLGAPYQLLLIAGLIGFVAVVGGLLGFALGGERTSPGEAIWWAFLRLTDPGYLGDDEGALRRTVSTVITILGYVLFMGSLIAILTQGLQRTMRKLESGLTPIAIDGHILVLGWTNRTAAVVNELMRSEERVRRFMRRRRTRALRIVVLAEEVSAALMHELRGELGSNWNERQVILRSGLALRVDDLRRVDVLNASAVILPGGDFEHGNVQAPDTEVIKTLMSIATQATGSTPPPIVAEIFDARKIPIARQAYSGELDLIASDLLISRLIVQNVRHRGLSHVYNELLTHGEGSEVYVRQCPDLAGNAVRDLQRAFPNAILLGVARPEGPRFRAHLNPAADVLLAPEDRVVVIARNYEESAPVASGRRHGRTAPPPDRTAPVASPPRPPTNRRLLILGWSHKLPSLLQECSSYTEERFEVDIVSLVPVAERDVALRRTEPREGLQLRHVEADYAAPEALAHLSPERYDNVILLGSDWLGREEDADARTVLGYVLLQSLLPAKGPRPDVLVELLDPENSVLFQDRPGEVIISPLILRRMLAHVALRRELSAVFDELFGPGGSEIFFRPARDYGLAGKEVGFHTVQEQVARLGAIALGVRVGADAANGGLCLNPLPETRWRLTEKDEVVVLATYAPEDVAPAREEAVVQETPAAGPGENPPSDAE